MREIKFRAWNGERMKEVLTWGFNEKFIRTPKESSPEQDFKIMQYTGLKDKNGKEIYEGDVVEYQYLNTLEQEVRKAEVKLLSIGDVNRNITAYYPFCYSISGSYKERDREITECYLTPANDCEVIGNIYENPELLT